MTKRQQILACILLLLFVPIGAHAIYLPAVDTLPPAVAFVLAFVVWPLALAALVYWRDWFSDISLTETEERLFRPYYTTSSRDRLKVIGALALLGLLPLWITVLMLPEWSWPWAGTPAISLVLLIYVGAILGYGSMLFDKSRPLYRRSVIPALIVIMALSSGYGILFEDTMLERAPWYLILLSVGITYAGGALLLSASRGIADAKSKAESELAFAGEVQRQFLESTHVSIGGTSAYATSQPARQLGGDFFHLSEGRDGQLVAAVGDVSGHSFGAGLIMTMLKTSLENFLNIQLGWKRLFETLNEQLLEQSGHTMFASLACMELDVETGAGTLWNAGHLPMLHYCAAKGTLAEIHTPGLALGLSARARYEPLSFSARPGDWLIMYSDGLVETRDASGDVRRVGFFSAVVADVLGTTSTPEAGAGEIMRRISEAHRDPFLGDDATLIVVRLGPGT